MKLHLIPVVLSLISFSVSAETRPATAPATEIRALWVTRGDYRTADDVRQIIANAAAMNFNVVLFQVRGNGTVFYKSSIEPWAFELTSDDPATTGKDPGWDPLRLAIDEARRHGVELHAWINVFPAWRSQQYPPKDSGQLWWSRPEWFMHDAAGERMIPRDQRVNPSVRDWYSFLSPGVPEVQEYLADVCEELVRSYEIDGLHYDYIRYPREIREVKPAFKDRAQRLGNWSYDPVSLKRFSEETGVAKPDDDPEQWIQWRADQVTATVRKIAERVRPIRSGLVITAAVGADPVDSQRGKAQAYIEWMEKGLVDAVFTMGYTADTARFKRQCEQVLAHRPGRGHIAAGIGVRGGASVVAEEIDITRALGLDGFAAFSYGGLFDRRERRGGPVVDELREGAMAGKAALPWERRPADSPAR